MWLEPGAAPRAPGAPGAAALDARLHQMLEDSWAEFELEYALQLRPAAPVHQRGQQPTDAHQQQAQQRVQPRR